MAPVCMRLFSSASLLLCSVLLLGGAGCRLLSDEGSHDEAARFTATLNGETWTGDPEVDLRGDTLTVVGRQFAEETASSRANTVSEGPRITERIHLVAPGFDGPGTYALASNSGYAQFVGGDAVTLLAAIANEQCAEETCRLQVTAYDAKTGTLQGRFSVVTATGNRTFGFRNGRFNGTLHEEPRPQ